MSYNEINNIDVKTDFKVNGLSGTNGQSLSYNSGSIGWGKPGNIDLTGTGTLIDQLGNPGTPGTLLSVTAAASPLGAGKTAWVEPFVYTFASFKNTATISVPATPIGNVIFDTIIFNHPSFTYNGGTGELTVGATGFYEILLSGSLTVSATNTAFRFDVKNQTTGTTLMTSDSSSVVTAGLRTPIVLAIQAQITAGDIIVFESQRTNGSGTAEFTGPNTVFGKINRIS